MNAVDTVEKLGLNKDSLSDLYSVQGLSTIMIATRFSISASTVGRALKLYGIPKRQAFKINDNISDANLIKEYVDSNKSILSIARQYNMTRSRVTKRLKDLCLEVRSIEGASKLRTIHGNTGNFKVAITKEQLEDLYLTQQLPTTKIAPMFNVGRETIASALRRYNIPIRTLSERSLLKWEDDESRANQLTWRRSPEGRLSLSNRMQERMANGYCPCASNRGTYVAKSGSDEHYCSLLELAYFLYLDYNGIMWTKNHGIKIRYHAPSMAQDGALTAISLHNYIPDFLINNEVLVETKGWEGINFQEKFDAAMRYCDAKNLVYEVIWHDEWINDNKEFYEEAKWLHHSGIGFP